MKSEASSPRARIVVGYDGSPASVAALQWAAAQARLEDAELVAVHQVTGTAVPERLVSVQVAASEWQRACAQVKAEIAAAAPGLDIDLHVTEQPIARELIETARGADLLAVGTTARHATTSMLLDSVARAVVQAGSCPVLLVPEGTDFGSVQSLVVGVDRSPASAVALRWAVRQAALRSTHVLAAQVVPRHGHQPAGHSEIPLEEWVKEQVPEAGGLVSCSTSTGDPAESLLAAGHGLALLVIGSRGPHHFWSHSATRELVFHSATPLVVVPEASTHPADTEGHRPPTDAVMS